MDKKVIFAVAGSGKTTYIIDTLSPQKRTLIVTYTVGNYSNLCSKILHKFDGMWPESVHVMTYFQFLYRFCYKPFLADKVKAKGICYEPNRNRNITKKEKSYYITDLGYFYSNRLELFIEKSGIMNQVKHRLERFFVEFVIDEVQDIAGRDFAFLEQLMSCNINMLFVGDFYQHTFDTSRDGTTNKNLFKDFSKYEERFTKQGFKSDKTTLVNSWRCSPDICDFITNKLGIKICSSRSQNSNEENGVIFVSDQSRIEEILNDPNIIKLHYQNGSRFGKGHKNWGKTKGEDQYGNVCVLLNSKTMSKYKKNKLNELAPSTKNKLYVAITRAHGKVYLVDESRITKNAGKNNSNSSLSTNTGYYKIPLF